MNDYESMGMMITQRQARLEALDFRSVLSKQAQIERRLYDKLDKYRQATGERASTSANKLQLFLNDWLQYKLDDNLNIENINPLLASAGQLAIDNWDERDFFIGIRDYLSWLLNQARPFANATPDEESPDVEPLSTAKPDEDFGAQEEAPAAEAPAEPAAEAPAPEASKEKIV